MTDIDTEEYARRIMWLTNHLNYRLKFPILSWSIKNNVDDLLGKLLKGFVTFELYKGSNYDTYAENDYDLCIITNINKPENQELTLTSNITSINCVDIIVTNIENVKVSYPFLWNQNFENLLGISYFSHHFTDVLNNIFPNRKKVKIVGTKFVSIKEEKILAQL